MTRRHPPLWIYAGISVVLIAATAFIQFQMGRVPISKSGTIKLWVGEVNGPENSQQIADWYTFSHIIHGFIFYGACRLIGRGKWPLGLCLLLTVFIEASWEVAENTSMVIDHYREKTVAVDYYGDSILNSMSDILFCVAGFFLAARLPVWITLAMILVMELSVGFLIRDNLTLNILMFIYPFDTIKNWQMG